MKTSNGFSPAWQFSSAGSHSKRPRLCATRTSMFLHRSWTRVSFVVLETGTRQLCVTFTPTDATKYNTATKTVSIDVLGKTDLLQLKLEIWKKIIDVQQHFNDVSLTLRSVAIPVLVGSIGGAGYAFLQGHALLALAVVAGGVLAWGGFFLMDRFWYHEFLRAAVEHGKDVETILQNDFGGIIRLSWAISNASQSVKLPRWPKGKDWYILRGGTKTSKHRLEYFYRLGLIALLGTGAVIVSGALLDTFWKPVSTYVSLVWNAQGTLTLPPDPLAPPHWLPRQLQPPSPPQ